MAIVGMFNLDTRFRQWRRFSRPSGVLNGPGLAHPQIPNRQRTNHAAREPADAMHQVVVENLRSQIAFIDCTGVSVRSVGRAAGVTNDSFETAG